MPLTEKAKKIIFGIIFYAILAALFSALFYYNKSFFINLTTSKEVLQFKHKILLYFFQAFVLILLAIMIFFKDSIYKRKKEISLLLISLIICFVLLEVGARAYVCSFADSDLRSRVLFPGQCGLNSKYEPHHYLNYHGTPNYQSEDNLNMHNSLGFRGPEIETPKPEDIYRIVTVGGSTTYSTGVANWEDDFARKLQKNLQDTYNYSSIEVINAGLGGWNSWESLINLEFNVINLEPDLIIIYHGANDVHARILNPTNYKSDNSGLREQWEFPKTPLIFKSILARILSGTKPVSLIDITNTPTSAEGVEYTGFMEILNATPFEAVQKNPPIYFERNLRSMIAIAEEFESKVILATWAYNSEIGGRDHASLPHYELGFEENNEAVKKVAEAKKVPLYDFNSEMPRNLTYWEDGMHLNVGGVELKAKLFTQFIQDNHLIDFEILKLKQQSI